MNLFLSKLPDFKYTHLASSLLNEIEESFTTSYFSIDRFENNFAVCENRKNLTIKNITISKIHFKINKSQILKYKNHKFYIDFKKTLEVQKNIKQKSFNAYKH